MKTSDPHIRKVLHTYLRNVHAEGNGVMIDELALSSVVGRVDVTVVNSHLHAYEIKSDVDKLALLRREVAKYGKVMDFLSLVTTRRHIDAARCLIPDFWGVLLYDDGRLEEQRAPRQNVTRSAAHLAQLLWRDTSLELLQQRDAAKGMAWRAKRVLHGAIVETCTIEQIHEAVRLQFMRHRRGIAA